MLAIVGDTRASLTGTNSTTGMRPYSKGFSKKRMGDAMPPGEASHR